MATFFFLNQRDHKRNKNESEERNQYLRSCANRRRCRRCCCAAQHPPFYFSQIRNRKKCHGFCVIIDIY